LLKKLSKKLSIMLAILLIMTSLLGFLTPTGVIAEEVYATDLFFSEYIEGGSLNKAIEIFNGTANTVELAQYTVELYSNGATTAGSKITLSGNLDSGEVYVIVHGSALDSFKTYMDLENNTVINFNGDDALVLRHNGLIIDSFGQVGVDPGTYWGTVENNTLDHTLVRKSSVTIGDSISDDAFDPSIEWDFDVKDTYSKLGSHIMNGFGSGEPGTIAAVTAIPGGGAVAIGTRVSLSCTTEGAVIMYSINEGEDVVYNNTEQITLDVLPASINAYATKDGQSGAISTFNYTQAQVAVVTASPAAGAVYTGTEVNLSTATDGATIFYRIGEDVVETEYSAPIVIGEATTIKAIAKKSGLSDSNEATFSYTVKAPAEEITIAEARATALESTVKVTGVVTWMDGATKAYIQDESAAIVVDLYYIPGTKPTFVVGDEVTATGTLVKYNQLLTVKLAAAEDVVKASSNNALPEPKLITIADAKTEIYEAQLVKLEGLTLGTIATGGNTPVTDAANNTINIYRIVLPTGIIAGDIINTIAMVSKHTTGYQLRIRSAEDVTKIEAPDTIPPVIAHTPVMEGNTGLDLNIKAVVTDNKQVSAVNLAYRTIGETTYTYNAMTFSNGEYAYAIPKIKLLKAGLEYYIEASDGVNTTTVPANIEIPYSVAISEVDIAAPEISNLTPADGTSTGDNLRPIISANYNDTSGIDISSVKVYLDDTEITAQCTIGENGFTTTPTSDLAKGEHIVRVVVMDNAAAVNQAEVSWKFYVGEDVYNFYFGQLHSHTGEISDGEGTLDDAYTWARDKGMADFFAVTDHSNWFDNEKDLINESITRIDDSTSAEWKKVNAKADYYNKDGEFVAIAGFEMTWSGSTGGWGHINTFNTPWFASRSNSAMNLKAYYQKLAQSPNSLSQLNHPGKTFGDFADFGFYSEAADNVVNLIEVGNGEGSVRGSGYFPSYEYYTKALDRGWHLAPSNNQDNHKGNWITSNDARTVILSKTLTRDSVFDAIRMMHVYSSEDKNLEIMYKANGNIMGSTLDAPETLNITIDISDPDQSDKIGKVSIISNGGMVVASRSFDDNEALWELELDAQYSYYYVRVDQGDMDIAVTAPIWTNEVTAIGISNMEVSQDPQIINESIDISATVYNNSSNVIGNVIVEFYKNAIAAGNKIGEDAISIIESGTAGVATIKWTSDQVGKYNIYAKTIITINGVEKVFTNSIFATFANPEDVIKVVLDRAHYNAYISGDYAGKDLTFREMLKDRKYMLVENNDELTAEDLKGAQILIITDPQSTDSATNDLKKSIFTDAEVAVIKEYTDHGGSLIISSKADYNDGVGEYSNGAQLNKILEAVGTNLRVNDDEVVDNTLNGGQPYRLYFNRYSSTKYNLTNDIPEGTTYSFYSGSSVVLRDGGSAEAVDWIVKGHTTTETLDSDYQGDNVAVAKGNVNVIGAELLSCGAKIIVAGSIFFSDFETASSDNSYSNKQITGNILSWMIQPKVIQLKTIAEVRTDANNNGIPDFLGQRFTIEGRVTAQSEAVMPKNAFFEVIYVQDATGGITVFGISATPLPLGTKVRITGVVDQYDGDTEISIESEANDLVVIDDEVVLVEPIRISTRSSMLEENEGWLVKVQGRVTRMMDNSMYLNDGSGEARVYVNGYITDGTDNQDMHGKWDPSIQVGDIVSAIGLASEDAEGHRLRVRNTGEIVRITDNASPIITITGVTDGGIYNRNITPIVTVDKGSIDMTLNDNPYSGGIINLEGVYSLEVTAVDNENNTAHKTISFTIDKTAPVITSNIKNMDTVGRVGTMTIINTAVDNISGLAALVTKLDSETIDNTSNIDLETLSIGTHHMTITAADKAGNSSYQEIDFMVDTTIDSLENLLVKLYEEGQFKNKGIFNSFMAILDTDNLKPFENHLKAQKGKGISIEAAETLQAYINHLNTK
jgi:predicted extracellular nuclease